ncbi:hypothetical protein L228DRAFT_268732 [Xylona heveae TC161]|uniref:Glutaredoxin-like protein n=1 Tax=Xylona heveae (strain CBS 132557 / TC161) TaxID=1328760 RepID=A0A165GJ99_XYLHT|nr:hypothetical protein L228DRAFT_268732 [Xylona heveae TC161]KZF22256.1 hypothetical protein L228DRAFT_268732 [Xylona heveae TC161]
MRPSFRLLQHACRITMFSRENCGLCDKAKTVLSRVWDRRPFEYKEYDVMKHEDKGWKDLYEFDTPVIHIKASSEQEENPSLAGQARKLMHRFTEEEVEKAMDEAEKKKS